MNGGASIARSPLVAVRLAHVGPHHEPRLEGGVGERLGDRGGPWKRRSRGGIGDELDPGQEAAAPHVTDRGSARSASSRW